MPSSIGMARRMAAANDQIDAAVVVLAPDADPPTVYRNQRFAEVVRAEWLADVLSSLAGVGQVVRDDQSEPSQTLPADEAAALEATVDAGPGNLPTGDALRKRLNAAKVDDLRPVAKRMGVDPDQRKAELIDAIVAAAEGKDDDPNGNPVKGGE